MEFRIIEHTADTGIEVRAPTLNELFEGAACAMMSIITDSSKVHETAEKEASLDAGDLGELMFVWLNELIYIINSGAFLFSRFEVEVEDTALRARMWGEEIDPDRHGLMLDIKAATYHELEVRQTADGSWEARVIFDV